MYSLRLLAPGLWGKLASRLTPSALGQVSDAFDNVAMSAGLEHFLVPRVEGQSFNPRPARIASLAMEELSMATTDQLVSAVVESFQCHLDHRGNWEKRYRPIAALNGISLTAWQLAELLDTARHLHLMQAPKAECREVRECMSTLLTRISADSPFPGLLRKLEHTLVLQSEHGSVDENV